MESKSSSGKVTKTLRKSTTTHGLDEHGKDIIVTHWKRKMVNYASMGFDGRVGLGFDSKRTNSRFCNKAMYGWEGFKKIFCSGGGPTMQNLIEKFEVIVDAKLNKQAFLNGIPDTMEL